MKDRIIIPTALVLSSLLVFAVTDTLATPTLSTLQPGQFREINQNLQINIVFVGYEQGNGPRDINEAVFRAGLPSRYRTIDYSPSAYLYVYEEDDAVWIGNSFDYSYNIVYANQAFEDAYFSYLSSIAIPIVPTIFDDIYNTQTSRSLTINSNSVIDASLAEKWLADHATNIGVDPTRYTVFLVNWYGRPDFIHHIYFKPGEPDPDTGEDFGYWLTRLMTAFGGTTPDDEQNGLGSVNRIWFFDLSTNPGWGLYNMFIDYGDLDGDGVVDYTMPPTWEYGNLAAGRPFNDLSGDLSKITRYIALDCLFTHYAISPPALSPPKMPNSIQFDINLYQVDPTWNLRDYIKPAKIVSEHAKLRPYNTHSISVTDLPFDVRQSQVFLCGRSQYIKLFVDWNYPTSPCYGGRGNEDDLLLTAFFLYHRDHLNRFIEGDADLEVPGFIYGTPDSLAVPLGGYQDDNHYDGTRSSFFYAFLRDSGRQFAGVTETTIHEAGHYMGMSHPHDGFDYERLINIDPVSEFFYVWVGDESDTVMSYNRTSNNFSQFDRDNMNRYMTAIYINQANKILVTILASPRASEVDGVLLSADADATAALNFYQGMNYISAATKAKAAYDKVLAAAAQINISIEPAGWPSDYRRHVPNHDLGDPVFGHQHPFLSPSNVPNAKIVFAQ